MKNFLLLLDKKHTDTLIEQTKKTQETLKFLLNKQLDPFFLNSATDSMEEWKWLIEVTIFEPSNSILNQTQENHSFSIATPNFWTLRDGGETITKLNELMELRPQKDIEIHIKDFEKRGTRIGMENGAYNIAGTDFFKKVI